MEKKQNHHTIALLLLASACTVSKPKQRTDGGDGTSCAAAQPLRCEDSTLVRCNGDGTAEVNEPCTLGCSAAELRCADPIPSNTLAQFLDQVAKPSDLDLGGSATINTDTGEVTVAGAAVNSTSDIAVQSVGKNIRVFAVRSLTAKDVVVIGTNALAILSSGDVRISGTFTASARANTPGAGSFNDTGCQGKNSTPIGTGGAGGGGFGSSGGPGGPGGTSGGAGGMQTGNQSLVPLRGGCDGGGAGGGGGGGAIQLFSRTRIIVAGAVAANGGGGAAGGSAGFPSGGGGSGGGILLEASAIEVSGNVVANGGSGSACAAGQDGQLNATPAAGAPECFRMVGVDFLKYGAGGNGGVGNSEALPGASPGGHGGGGVGRIRINTAPGGFHSTGVFSPAPNEGPLATR